ncbi:MAG: hypothetical protein IMZ52_04440 [Actinobacteria bacterium]|nr:hypothetical protein [Actinomycetota bacterium]MBE3122032.1 hypothetical protein [Thermoplasmata archaeon]
MLKGKKLPVRYAVAITCIWELIFISYVAFYGESIGAVKTYGDYLYYPPGMIAWMIFVAFFSSILPFCFTDYFKEEKEDD